mmetsp:Transcript_48889/g.77901  ORF Transcript_48889/g.77901 Transcript_48889/m.77901 type:complete len:118 (-) Transcript_48889:794-1147(-)
MNQALQRPRTRVAASFTTSKHEREKNPRVLNLASHIMTSSGSTELSLSFVLAELTQTSTHLLEVAELMQASTQFVDNATDPLVHNSGDGRFSLVSIDDASDVFAHSSKHGGCSSYPN